MDKIENSNPMQISNGDPTFQNKVSRAQDEELVVSHIELLYKHHENEKRTAEVTADNRELALKNEELEKRVAELIIANNEHVLLIEEKEKHVQLAKKELDSFSYSVSHDLRAPLRVIQGYTQMLQSGYESKLDSEGNRLMSKVVKNASKMGRLIDDLLSYSRMGQHALAKSNVSMQKLVANICDELKIENPDRHIEFNMTSLLPARADNSSIKQVWFNLISNAVKYSAKKENAIIVIGSEEKENEILNF